MFDRQLFESSFVAMPPAGRVLLLKKYAAGSGEVPCGKALVIWAADLLTRVQPIDTDQRNLILDTFADDICKIGDTLGPAVDGINKSYPAFKLGIADRRYVFVSGNSRFLDIVSGEVLTSMRKMPLEEVYYNLTALFVKHHALIMLEKQKMVREAVC